MARRSDVARWVVPLVVLALLASMRRRASSAPVNSVGPRLSLAALRELAARVGFPDPDTAAAVAMAESGGNPSAVNDTRGRTDLPAGTQQEYSLGLWQVNALAHTDVDATRLLDPEYNARSALLISNGGTDWHAWSAFTRGLYRKYMPQGAP